MTARALLIVLLAAAAWAETPDDLRALVRQSLARLEASDKKAMDYGFVRRVERKEFVSGGKIKSQSSLVLKRELEDGFMVTRPIERDGKPLPEEERRKNEETLQKRLAELKALTPEQLEQRRAENRKREGDEDAWLKEFPEALDYQLAGEETIDGRPAVILDCTPRKGYRARNMRARIFEKVRGRVWIDKAESELVKAEAEVFDTVSIAFGLVGKIEKGTRFFIQRKRVGSETWLPEAEAVRFAARVMLFKSINNEVTTRNAEFRHRSELAARAPAP